MSAAEQIEPARFPQSLLDLIAEDRYPPIGDTTDERALAAKARRKPDRTWAEWWREACGSARANAKEPKLARTEHERRMGGISYLTDLVCFQRSLRRLEQFQGVARSNEDDTSDGDDRVWALSAEQDVLTDVEVDQLTDEEAADRSMAAYVRTHGADWTGPAPVRCALMATGFERASIPRRRPIVEPCAGHEWGDWSAPPLAYPSDQGGRRADLDNRVTLYVGPTPLVEPTPQVVAHPLPEDDDEPPAPGPTPDTIERASRFGLDVLRYQCIKCGTIGMRHMPKERGDVWQPIRPPSNARPRTLAARPKHDPHGPHGWAYEARALLDCINDSIDWCLTWGAFRVRHRDRVADLAEWAQRHAAEVRESAQRGRGGGAGAAGAMGAAEAVRRALNTVREYADQPALSAKVFGIGVGTRAPQSR